MCLYAASSGVIMKLINRCNSCKYLNAEEFISEFGSLKTYNCHSLDNNMINYIDDPDNFGCIFWEDKKHTDIDNK